MTLDATPDRSPARWQFVRDNQVPSFVALTLGLSWAIWIPTFVRFEPGAVPGALVVPGAFGPIVAAALVTWASGDSVRDWLRSIVDWRARPRWYLAALGVPVAMGVVVGVALGVGAETIDWDLLRRSVAAFPITLAFAAVAGGGQEEPGWRGFALPRLQERYDAFSASLIVGVVWALWHLPLFVFESGTYSGQPYYLYVATVVGWSVLFTWLYNGSGGVVPVAILFHAAINTALNVPLPVVGADPDVLFFGTTTIVGWAAVLAIVLRHGRETLADGPAVTANAGRDRPRSPGSTTAERGTEA